LGLLVAGKAPGTAGIRFGFFFSRFLLCFLEALAAISSPTKKTILNSFAKYHSLLRKPGL
jgi:hypothetical protein